MSKPGRAPRVVAELGRPETPQETADRKAENSRKYRAQKTVNNLVLSLIVTVAAVLLIVMLVPRNDNPVDRSVDFAAVATQLQPSVDEPLAVPVLPEGWSTNAAEWRTADAVSSWYLGLVTPEKQFIGFSQAIDANPTWLAQQLLSQAPVDSVQIDGITWDMYRNPAPTADRGNFDEALVTTAGSSTYLLIGTAPETEFEVLARVLAASIANNQ
ncbi:DUF4245 domain-containing protein [Cryobacterium psychrophilum]|uniref:DUF4245 domain-containing protein n=1 Tax=Cryobacterium psychrophilum TaxID=41988 RepID=A0A4Y8KLE4_9MICO|nr:DUF4245 domain-containing protein [Cryobacterium psychrophilum]TDW30832.1 uncharacterized protein DUF4245 [Cryobacterium psychrophilum]TFD75776.1 DUF4245 domain-containing protein [Cryobacterium psychrophilum]